MEKFDAWLAQIHDDQDEFAYRAIYSAYLNAAGVTGPRDSVHRV
ncbi:hypothetical protein ACFYTS_22420 [Nocardia sp. NPDC004151]